jgi:xanthine dehydrogenase iron-sulfur cluster and FAD-binding subunit A
MSAAALLKSHPRPTDDDIDAAMNGNLCRCATYLRIRAGIHRAAAIAAASDARPANTGAPGQDPEDARRDRDEAGLSAASAMHGRVA